MKLLSLFSGIGAFEKALTNLNIDFELVGYSEIDKYASKAYSLIHNENESKNLGDITKIDATTLSKDIDLITYGFPCQDISVAGNQKGFFNSRGEKTRSGLFFYALNVIQAVQPKIAIAENVKNLTGKRFKKEFETVLDSLEQAGYNNYYKVLNAKDYGVPQSRERVFIVSIRKDIDNRTFAFPGTVELTKRLKDILENDVDEKYYLKKPAVWFIQNSDMQKKIKFESTNKILQLGQMYPNSGNPQAGRIYDEQGISPSLDTCQGGNRQPKIAMQNEKTIVTSRESYVPECPFRIRKLTPKECFRLMGFNDGDVDVLIENKISNSQLYKMAGNSICVPVLEAIFKQLYLNKKDVIF